MASGKSEQNPLQQFICEFCYQPFIAKKTKTRARRFCSRNCASRRQGLPLISCPICGQTFKPTKDRGKYCSIECYHRSKKVNHPKIYMYDKCILCGKHYIPIRANQSYCSHECYTVSLRKLSQKPCAYCGKIMFDIPKNIKKRTYCSYVCNNKARFHPKTQNYKIKYRGRNWKEQSEKARIRDNFTCQICQTYQVTPTLTVHHIKRYREFNGDYKSANELNNLITLCRSCHSKVEGLNLVRSSLKLTTLIK